MASLKGIQQKEVVLVSKCLLGSQCQHDGTSASRRLEPALVEKMDISTVPVCPEELGGCGTPRPRVEIFGGDGRDVLEGRAKVVTLDGEDRTEAMLIGARKTLQLARKQKAVRMISRRRSPSCSAQQIPDGTFTKKRIEGVGVTVAMLQAEMQLPVVELEQILMGLITEAVQEILLVYRAAADWNEKIKDAKAIVNDKVPLENAAVWEETVREAFRIAIPGIHSSGNTDDEGREHGDSDTVRFFQQVFREAWGVDLIDPMRRCRICTYPEGFLDVHLSKEGICSACTSYEAHKILFEDKVRLRRSLSEKLDEIRGKYKYDAVVACSGGKDSTYIMLKLREKYDLNLLCVMNDLNQQDDVAIQNAKEAAKLLEVEFRKLPPPDVERDIRRNFLLAGNSFCRLCLRSHFVRMYDVAIQEQVPLIFFGLSPYQLLDCPDAIQWSLEAIRNVETPFASQNVEDVVRRYRHRAFQGGFDVGFSTDEEKSLLKKWQSVFESDHLSFAPLLVPFFLFDDYPSEDDIMKTIVEKVEWSKPEVLLHHTNCRLLRAAGIFHRAVGRFHLNYKEHATALRFLGKRLSEHEAKLKGAELDCPGDGENMSAAELDEFLRNEFSLSQDDLPQMIQGKLVRLLHE